VCGIIGYAGRRRARTVIVSGLERLEYRGYDSCGLCLVEGGALERVRVVGPTSALERSLNGHGPTARAGIGHTRWATHGRVCEENAHPFLSCDGAIALCLNGIVENFSRLRSALGKSGHVLRSDTDAEVVVHLVEQAYRGDLAAAVAEAAAALEGHFAFVCCHREHPELVVGTRRDCPLVVGLGVDETFLASSTTAFLAETRWIQSIENGEVVAATPAGPATFQRGSAVERAPLEAAWDDETADRGAYESFMLKEIHEQPAAVRASLAGAEIDPAALRDVRRLVLVGCGTSYHAGLLGRYLVESWAGIPCEVEIASEWRYREPRPPAGTLVVAVSQSGETADTLAALRLARAEGVPTLAVTNMPGSEATRVADATLLTRCGLELGVAATKTFAAQAAALGALALGLAEARGALDAAQAAAHADDLARVPERMERFLAGVHPLEAIAERHAESPFFLYLGRHAGHPVALEGALKLREIAYVPTEAYAAGEMKHGPIALVDDSTPVVVVATRSPVSAKLLGNVEEVRARGARVIAIASDDDEAIQHLAEDVVYVPGGDPLLTPLVAALPLQLLAHRIARLRGLDPDRPRNLAKTVTVE
jgi:glucosamine--fructose-6-phosphate aminotransferase (isomerizing)